MRVVHVSAEVHPFAMTGGLGGVAGSLPQALAAAGHETAVIAPYYSRRIRQAVEWLSGEWRTWTGESFGVASARLPGGVPVYFVAEESLFGREGYYGPSEFEAYPDNALRFSFFCRAAAALIGSTGPWDVVHCHDWHSGLVPPMLDFIGGPPAVFTIHNLAFQGRFDAALYPVTGLPPGMFSVEGLEFYGDFSFMKGGIVYSRAVTTVSPGYAREIQLPSGGCGLDGVLRSRSQVLFGILNGIDTDLWGPEDDPLIAAPYAASSLRRKLLCRDALVAETCLDAPRRIPLAAVVSRLTPQKGMDLLAAGAAGPAGRGEMALVVLGSGERWIEDSISALAADNPGRVFFRTGWDEDLSHRLFAGSDIFLMPSRFEPCGLTQMIAMRYGSLPVARRTGGLADTVADMRSRGTGFLFDGDSPADLEEALSRAIDAFIDRRAWRSAMRRGMARDDSWASRMPAYEEVYAKAADRR
ncbi:glycogen synthase GlgA [Candidatus Fermentibacteria bacterium]|nr:glycogen synthase GlgA [Candidatus Fermentibacteria bacterium]